MVLVSMFRVMRLKNTCFLFNVILHQVLTFKDEFYSVQKFKTAVNLWFMAYKKTRLGTNYNNKIIIRKLTNLLGCKKI